MMTTRELKVRFVTPAFLGDAEQSGRWRTPPFKALLRQWWRIAYAADHGFRVNVVEMRREEGRLFGSATDGEGNRSLIRMRLDRWDVGSLKSWNHLEQQSVHHPEAEKAKYQVGPHAYLGFGPLDGRGGTKLAKANAAIQAGETATFSLALPESDAGRIDTALLLMDRYGTLGGRSRNAWGSFSLTPLNGTPALKGEVPRRPWHDALGLDWPHAIGEDEAGLLAWQTRPCDDWKTLMRELAIIKIGLRTQFLFTTGKNAPHPEERHWLSHPVTGHNVGRWKQARLPNSLRFKMRPDATDPESFFGVIFHVPCRPPDEFRPDPKAIERTWEAVHALLDELTRPVHARAYRSIADASRRAKLKPQLDSLVLNRFPE